MIKSGLVIVRIATLPYVKPIQVVWSSEKAPFIAKLRHFIGGLLFRHNSYLPRFDPNLVLESYLKCISVQSMFTLRSLSLLANANMLLANQAFGLRVTKCRP